MRGFKLLLRQARNHSIGSRGVGLAVTKEILGCMEACGASNPASRFQNTL